MRVSLATALDLPRCGRIPSDIIEAMHTAENIVSSCPPVNKWEYAAFQSCAVGKAKHALKENSALFVSHNPKYHNCISPTVPPWTFGTSADTASHSYCTYTDPSPIVTSLYTRPGKQPSHFDSNSHYYPMDYHQGIRVPLPPRMPG